MSKVIIFCVGDINKFHGIGTEDFSQSTLSVKETIMALVTSKAGIGIETQAMDTEGIGTGLPYVTLSSDVTFVEASDVNALKTELAQEISEDTDRIIVLGNNIHMGPKEVETLDNVKSEGAVIYNPDEVPDVANELVKYASASDTPLDVVEGLESSDLGNESFKEPEHDEIMYKLLNPIR